MKPRWSEAGLATTLPGQPFTFGGVAGISQSWGRLLAVQTVVAVLAATAVVWLVISTWVPIVHEAISRLPEGGSIRDGSLIWHGESLTNLASGKFLSISVNVEGLNETGSEADLQMELGRNEVRIQSILGYVMIPYPRGWMMALNRVELEPWWGAWKPALFAAVGAAVIIGLFVSWSGLAAVYCMPVRVVAFYADRQLSWTGAWRLSAAALIPGAFLLTCAIAAYSLQQINLIQLLGAGIIHVAVSWIYLLGAPFRLPVIQSVPRTKNPFVPGKRS